MKTLTTLAVLVGLSVGCIASTPPNNPSPFEGVKFDSFYTNGLTNEERFQYTKQDEGIRWLESSVMVSLDRSDENGVGLINEPFFKNPERFGLYKNPADPNGLPLGISLSNDPGLLPTSGLNCSSCHDAMINFHGKSVIINGAGGLFEISRMVREMIFSLALTVSSPIEFYRFYERYQTNSSRKPKLSLAEDNKLQDLFNSSEYKAAQEHLKNLHTHNPVREEGLKTFKAHLIAKGIKDETLSDAYPTAEDLDSAFKVFGYMVKRTAFFYGKIKYTSTPAGTVAVPGIMGSADPWSTVRSLFAINILGIDSKNFAPIQGGNVRTPHIWGYERQHFVFLSQCTDDVLGRHLAQGSSLLTDFDWKTYSTTANIKKIEKISKWARKIKPPIWNENVFGKLDMAKVQAGEILAKQYCLNCHDPMLDKQDRASAYYNSYDVGTDDTYQKAQQAPYYGKNFFDILRTFIYTVKRNEAKKEGIKSLAPYEINRTDENWHQSVGNKFSSKPLMGLWATGPFLHNGSVASIRQLLTNEKNRSKIVLIGNLELDTKNLGFVQEPVWYGSSMDTTLIGNSNKGHSGKQFGTELSDDEKNNLLEYLKYYRESN